MKLTGELKDKVSNAETMEAKKDIIAEADMELTDDELEAVVGGSTPEIDEFNRVFDSFWAIQNSLDENDQAIIWRLWCIFGIECSADDYSLNALSALDKGILDDIHDERFKSEMMRTISVLV